MDRFLCIHGHFYQPPRENPWIGMVEDQPSARPDHDWNMRITRECYAPNGWARLLDDRGRITRLLNNYEYMSFNFGPTLLTWLERAAPDVYARILAADRVSRERNAGHGNALAQVYNHVIMPLADPRDRLTQIRWGLRDFEHRYGRFPEGMWLAETAVDSQTLALMAREGIRFTVLAPDQALRVRSINGTKGGSGWEVVSGGRVDPRRAYRVFPDDDPKLFIDVFFYDGPTSRAVAYERLLSSGAQFLARIEQAFGRENGGPRLVNLATDGESYGHHFKFGDMALAWVFDQVRPDSKSGRGIEAINYGAFLERFPPEYEAKIVENSAWSCPHALGRWYRDCGCHTGDFPEGSQAWRTPLRQGFDDLRLSLSGIFEEQGGLYLKDPWAARDDYIAVKLESGEPARQAFFDRHARRELSLEEAVSVLMLMESQVMALFMFTSCAWFFDDIARLEPIQNLKYAARAIDLVRRWDDGPLEETLLSRLEEAVSNDPEYKNGADLYRRRVAVSRINADKAVAHCALCRLLDDPDADPCLAAYQVLPSVNRRYTALGLTVLMGETKVLDNRTGSSAQRSFLALHGGGLDLTCRVGPVGTFDLEQLAGSIQPILEQASAARIREAFHLSLTEGVEFTLHDLVPDARNRLLRVLARDFFSHLKAWVLDNYAAYEDVLSMFQEAGYYPPARVQEADGEESDEMLKKLLARGADPGRSWPYIERFLFQAVWEDRLLRLLDQGRIPGRLDIDALRKLAAQASAWGVAPDRPEGSRLIEAFLNQRLNLLLGGADGPVLTELVAFLRLARETGQQLNPWIAQNMYDRLRHDPEMIKRRQPEQGRAFEALGLELGFAPMPEGR